MIMAIPGDASGIAHETETRYYSLFIYRTADEAPDFVGRSKGCEQAQLG